MRDYVTWVPYKEVPYNGINYTTCEAYDHISRMRGLLQVVHNPEESDRFVAFETPNPFTTNTEVKYYTVPSVEENRLDIIANKLLGSATYSWVLAYFNGIQDGFTVHEGQTLMVPVSFYNLFNKGEILQSVNPLALNLGSE